MRWSRGICQCHDQIRFHSAIPQFELEQLEHSGDTWAKFRIEAPGTLFRRVSSLNRIRCALLTVFRANLGLLPNRSKMSKLTE